LADLHAANDFEGEKIDLIVKPALAGTLSAHLSGGAARADPAVKAIEEVQAALKECGHHASILCAARAEDGDRRFAAENVEDLGRETVKVLDQAAYRSASFMTP